MLADHSPTKIHLAKKACGYFTPSPPLPLRVPSISLPPFPPTMESIWKIKCVTLDVICCLLPPGLSALPPCPCLCFFLSFSLSVYIWSQLQHLRPSVVCHQWNKWSNWKDCIVLQNSMGDIPYHLRPFVTSSQHCLYFIKYGLGMSHLNIRRKDRCVGVFVSNNELHDALLWK